MSPDRYVPGSKFLIPEEIHPRIIESLMNNYKTPQEAFLELIDNAVDNRIEGTPVDIRVRISKNELTVFNIGGKGLDGDDLLKFFVWGYSEKTAREIGFYGVGGKAAMGYLGRSMEVVCSPSGSNIEFKVADENWETRNLNEKKIHEAEVKTAADDRGYFRVKVTNLKGQIQTEALINRLADIYRPLLLTGEARISVNSRIVEPKEIRYIDEPRDLAPQTMTIQTRFGDVIPLKVGVLADGQRVKPGIRCYYHGRLIEEEEFFGLPTPGQVHQMSRLFGEVHLDQMTVTPNKANFVRNDPRWEFASRRIREVLQPWVDRLSREQFNEVSEVENYERELARRSKRILDGVLANTQLVTKGMLPGGEASGRLPAGSGKDRPKPRGGTRKHGPVVEGRTAPAPRADVGEDKIKRWGAFVAWESAPMGVNGKRSDLVNQNGRDTLIINSDHPLYQVNKKISDSALGLYLLETAVLKITEIVRGEGSVQDYIDFTDTLLAEVAQVYKNQVNASGQKRGRRG